MDKARDESFRAHAEQEARAWFVEMCGGVTLQYDGPQCELVWLDAEGGDGARNPGVRAELLMEVTRGALSWTFSDIVKLSEAMGTTDIDFTAEPGEDYGEMTPGSQGLTRIIFRWK